MSWNKCKYCDANFSDYTTGQKLNHAKFCKKNPKHEENLSKQRNVIGKIREKLTEESNRKRREGIKKAWKEGKYDNVDRSTNIMSDEAKHRASERMKKMRSVGIGSFNRKKSVPCDKFKEFLRNENFIFEEEFRPLKERQFCIDIAFPDEKIGIEINGNQHYSSIGCLAPYYQERHDLIESAGWKLYEIHYANCFNEDFLKLFIGKLRTI